MRKEEQQQLVDWVEDKDWVVKHQYEKDIDYLSCVSDILNHEIFQSLDQYIQHGATTTKVHSIQVSYLSFKLCTRLGWDAKAAARGGLLHDLFLYDWHTHARDTGQHFHGFTHPRTALSNAEKYFTLTEMEKNIILRHMWPLTPIPPKHLEGMAVVYADKICGLVEIFSRLRSSIVRRVPWISGQSL